MNRTSNLVLFCSLVSSVYSSFATESPFIFNPYTLQIYDWPDSPKDVIKGPFVTACPAQYRFERKMNRKQSMDGKALFVRESSHKENIPRSGIKLCENNYQLSVTYVRRSKGKIISFGFEIYYDKDEISDKVRKSTYDDYGPVEEARSWGKKAINLMKRPISPYFGDSSSDSEDILDFIWIPKITARIEPSLWSLIRTRYHIHHITERQLSVKCQDHDLGSRFYRKKYGPFDKFYDDQKKIFGLVKLPELPEGSTCKSKLKCVKKYDLVPPHRFESRPSSPVSCSNLTTVPIWYEITEKLLEYLEKFLVAISQVTKYKIMILPGTYDVISFPIIGRESKLMPLYLNAKKKKIPVPKIIYQLVWYQSYECKGRETLCWFSIVIVIHNHPKVTKNDMLCPKDKCKEWGWDNIQHMNVFKTGPKSKHIYCCKLDENLLKKFKYDAGNVLNEGLSLKDFPHFDAEADEDNIDRNYYVDNQKEFETQMMKLESQSQEKSNTTLVKDQQNDVKLIEK